MSDIIVHNTTTLKTNQEQISHLPLEQAAAQDSTVCDNESYKILVALLAALVRNTLNQDVVYLAALSARDVCERQGIPRDTFNRYAEQFIEVARKSKEKHPMGGMF